MTRIQRIDRALHLARARAAGLTEREAGKHARSEMQERRMLGHAELQTRGKPRTPDVLDKSGKPGKAKKG